jgi:hypothetical protein
MADEVAWLGLAVTASGFGFGLYQYSMNSAREARARRRESAVTAAEQTKAFFADPDVRFAMELLDHGVTPYRDEALKAVPCGVDSLPTALRPHWIKEPRESEGAPLESRGTGKSEDSAGISPEHRAVRTTFDNFLIWLERMEFLIGNGVISAKGFGDLFSYWLMLTGEISRPDDEVNHLEDAPRRAFWMYIRAYQFNAVVRLFQRYGRAAPVGVDGFRAREVVSAKKA